MTKRDLFRIILKLFGLYVAVGVFISIVQSIFGLFLDFDISFSLIALASLAIMAVILYILLFKTDLIVNLFQLDKGFDDDRVSTENMSKESIFNVGLVIISIYFIIDGIPDVVTQLISAFRDSIPRNTLESPFAEPFVVKANYTVLISASIQLALGFLLLTNRKRVARVIEGMNK